SLLDTLESSESALQALKSHANEEINAVQQYFQAAQGEVVSMKEGARTPGKMREEVARRRREKWAEMEQMRKYEKEVGMIVDNVSRREDVEKRLRGLLKEVGVLMLEREVLAREGAS